MYAIYKLLYLLFLGLFRVGVLYSAVVVYMHFLHQQKAVSLWSVDPTSPFAFSFLAGRPRK